ncbi:MAG: sialate O-acetylesterase [Planctomycetales bacterium]|jgi:sialate O-acetylesterase
MLTTRALKWAIPGLAAVASLATAQTVQADVSLSKIFGSNMVLQRDMEIPVWGWAEPGEKVTVRLDEHSATATAGKDKRWDVRMPAHKAGGPHTVTISGKNSIKLENVLIGEVWVCSGQSNMQYAVDSSDDPDLEKLTAKFPNIRLISVPQVGTQEPQNDFGGDGWLECSPETVGQFSGVGYFFGRRLHQTLDIPIGLIDNSWGGSACEAWVRRDVLQADDRYDELLARWVDTEKTYDHAKAMAVYQAKRQAWQVKAKAARAAGKPVPNAPRAPRNILAGQHRPANLYNGVLNPIIGYGIRGTIWYQGESNSSRAYQYRHLFPLMIQHWRDEWKQGDFPFYFVQLADFRDESADPQESGWAELREAQTMTLAKLPNTGQAVITDLGEAHDIHPKDKQNVARRLARWALAKDYGINIAYRSPEFKSSEVKGNKIIVTMGHIGGGLDTFDVRQPVGLTVAGEDKVFKRALGKIIGKDKIEVWSADVANPVAVRYAWADNPVCNLQSREGLPVTPFRSDNWPGVTIDVHK